MPRRALPLLGSLALVLAVTVGAPPAQAVTNSAPDGGGHPYAGVIVRYDDGDPTPYQGCSGVLVAPAVFLTAAHCVVSWSGQTGVTRYVTFQPQWSADDPPQRLSAIAGWAIPPGFGTRLPGGMPAQDVAVVELAAPVTGIVPARLPTAGLLDQLTAPGGQHFVAFDVVGYGGPGVDTGGGRPQPVVAATAVRQVATASFERLSPTHLVTDAVTNLGEGTNCYGDSGSPHLVAGTDVVVSTSSWIQGLCRSWSASVRLDTPDIRAFLATYVALP
jgi:hypothetical protein